MLQVVNMHVQVVKYRDHCKFASFHGSSEWFNNPSF